MPVRVHPTSRSTCTAVPAPHTRPIMCHRSGRTDTTGRSKVARLSISARGRFEESLRATDKMDGPAPYTRCAWGWTFAGNAPFRRWKRETYRGGVSDPFIVRWPRGIKAKGEIRTQYA